MGQDTGKVKETLRTLHDVLKNAAAAVERRLKDLDAVDRTPYLVKGSMGYDVQVNGVSLGMDVSWGQAEFVREMITQGQGGFISSVQGNDEIFCLRVTRVENMFIAPRGWEAGRYVCVEEDPTDLRRHSYVFAPCDLRFADFHDRDGIQRVKRDFESRFTGVDVEVVRFVGSTTEEG
jgi:hypothetical protein